MYTEGREIVKDVVKLAKGIKDMELKNQIMDLQNTFYDLIEENRDLKIQIDELKNKNTIGERLEKIGDYYYKTDDESPICSKCWEVDLILVHAQQWGDYSTFRCPNCKNQSYRTRSYLTSNEE